MPKRLNTKEISDAKKDYEKLRELIAPFVKKPVVEDILDPRIWLESSRDSAPFGQGRNSKTEQFFS